MKHLFLITCVAFTSLLFGQQACDMQFDYQNAAGWTIVDVAGSIPNNTQNHSVTIANGTIHLIGAADDYDQRAFRNLGTSLCDHFVVDFDFNDQFTSDPASGPNGNFGSTILALSAGTRFPWNYRNIGDNTSTDTDQDEIIISYVDGTNANDVRFNIVVKDGTTTIQQTSAPIMVNNAGGNYHITLERMGTEGRLTVEDNTTGLQVGTFCFSVPATVTGLNVIQHGNTQTGESPRKSDYQVSNTCIRDCFQLDDCCFVAAFTGPSEICGSLSLSSFATYTTPGSPNSS